MKKLFVSLILAIISQSSFANCRNIPNSIQSRYFYAEVISRSMFQLDLIVLDKTDYRQKVEVFGGKNIKLEDLQTCDLAVKTKVAYLNNNIQLATTSSFNHHTALYKVCVKNQQDEVIFEQLICNEEVGD